MEDKFAGGQEVQSNWFKFNAVGDGVKGTLVDKVLQESQDDAFGDQMIYKFKCEGGEIWNVGISMKKTGTIDRLNKCKFGEIVAVVFDSEGDSAIKGGHKAKNLKVYTYGMDTEFVATQSAGTEVVA